eukprot:m.980189 g.980189  ORF g.980189 m.980189 type:complete len:676 (+) comp23964_c1_seq3:86-2113(+)
MATGILSVAAVFIACWLSSTSARSQTNTLAPNLVENPMFDTVDHHGFPLGWIGNHSLFARDTQHTWNGSAASLRYDGSQGVPESCVQFSHDYPCWCTQQIHGARRGGRYTLSARVLGKGSVMVQWTKGGNWNGGSYPALVPPISTSGENREYEWMFLTQPFFVIPPDTDPGGVYVSVFNGYMHGNNDTSYFSDVVLREIDPPRLSVTLLAPNYRGRITDDGPDAVRFTVDTKLTSSSPARVYARLIDRSSETRVSSATIEHPNATGTYVMAFPITATALSPGSYMVEVECLAADGSVLAVERENITRVAHQAPIPPVFLDERNRLIVNESAFLPLGIYFQVYDINATTMALLQASPLKTIMPYGVVTVRELDIAHAHGIRVIVALDSYAPGSLATMVQRVALLRSHPAVLGWYLADEMGSDWLPTQVAHYNAVRDADPDHPIWNVYTGGQAASISGYTRAFDAAGADPYPIGIGPGVNASLVKDWTQYMVHGVSDSKPVWMVLQAWNHNNTQLPVWPHTGTFRSPTQMELQSMAWQALCAGSNGVVWYSFFEMARNVDLPFDVMWKRVVAVTEVIERHSSALLRERAPQPTLDYKGEWLSTRTHWVKAKSVYALFAVNDGNGEGTVTFTLAWPISGVTDITNATHHRQIAHTHTSFRDHIEPLGLRIYEVTVEAE